MDVIGLKMVFKTVDLDECTHGEHSLRRGHRTEPFHVPTLRGLEKKDFANRTIKGCLIRSEENQDSVALQKQSEESASKQSLVQSNPAER